MAQRTVVVDIALLGKMAGYIEMLVKDPYSTIFAALSDIYRTFGLLEEAVAVAQKGSEMLPSYAPGFVSLGRALAEKGDPAKASDAYRKALALDSVNLAALTGLASSCLGCGQKEEALALLNQAQSIDPDDEVVNQLFTVVKKLAAIPSPVTSFDLHDSFVPPSQAPLEITKSVMGEKVDLATGSAPLPSIATATLADIYIKQGFPERAIKVFRDLLEEDPGNAEIRQRLDALLQQINPPPPSEPEEVTVPLIEVETTMRTSGLSELKGKEALISLYGRWLDAVNRRRADVH
jgi:tetratricopeptide (TPR) repeat protein